MISMGWRKTETFVSIFVFVANGQCESLHGPRISHEHLRHDQGSSADIATGNVQPFPELTAEAKSQIVEIRQKLNLSHPLPHSMTLFACLLLEALQLLQGLLQRL